MGRYGSFDRFFDKAHAQIIAGKLGNESYDILDALRRGQTEVPGSCNRLGDVSAGIYVHIWGTLSQS